VLPLKDRAGTESEVDPAVADLPCTDRSALDSAAPRPGSPVAAHPRAVFPDSSTPTGDVGSSTPSSPGLAATGGGDTPQPDPV